MKAAQALLRWYDRYGRRLPWRRTRQPYRILVSEVMLQQTQVERVKVYYQSWLKQFPTVDTLAAASNADVLRAWAGLGYNRRALSLRNIAQQIVKNGMPKTYDAWLEVKGIGPYTAAAIMAFAYKEPRLPIDTNIRRVLGRFFLGKPYPQLTDDARIQRHGSVLLQHVRAHDVPQALFDLATMHCTKIPDCASCPMRTSCRAARRFLSGGVRVPKRMTKKANETRHRNKPYPDRIYRGRILKAVRERSMTLSALGPRIDPMFDPTQDRMWLGAMVHRLKKDGMVRFEKERVSFVS